MTAWKQFLFTLFDRLSSCFEEEKEEDYSQLLFESLSDGRITIFSLFGAKYYSHSVTHQQQ